MKNRLLPLTAASLIALVHPALSQETASPTPTPLPSPTATPLPASTPATASVPATPAEADSRSKASTASPDEIKAAEKADPAKVAESPEAPGDKPPSPVTGTTSESEAAGHVAAPSPRPAAASDADILPEPTDASLGAPIEPPAEAPLPTNDVAPSDLPNPDSLIPSGGSNADEAPPAAPTVTENKFDKDRKLQVRYQEVKLQALKDPAIRSLNDQAEKAKTDEMKRQALREYYRLLFAKMTSIDASLKDKCATMQQAYLRRLGQYRVTPSIPLAPPPTPEPLAN